MSEEFKIGYCDLCESEYVECPKCGNNTCNGGHGTVDGKPCDKCPETHAYADKDKMEIH